MQSTNIDRVEISSMQPFSTNFVSTHELVYLTKNGLHPLRYAGLLWSFFSIWRLYLSGKWKNLLFIMNTKKRCYNEMGLFAQHYKHHVDLVINT